MKSLPKVKGGFPIGIAHLLTPFARERLYTYPFPFIKPDVVRDCHWTSFNFFNNVPDDSLGDSERVRKILATDFYPVPGAPRFGDVMLFIRPDGQAVHSCVYIADDIVFTKNGYSYANPWILMQLSDLKAFYPSEETLEILTYRNKKL